MKLKAPKGKYIGPFTVRDFFDVFLPCNEQLPDATMVDTEKFRKVAEVESKSGPFLLALEACSSVMTFRNANDEDNKIGAQTGEHGVVSDAYLDSKEHESDVDPSPLELCIIFRHSRAYDPFQDPYPNATTTSSSKGNVSPPPPFERDHSARGNQTKSAITSIALTELETHRRAFVFSVLILKNEVRLIRWDRAGAVVTNRFNYVDNPRLLVEFFWRFAHLIYGERSHSPSVHSFELRILLGGLGRATCVSPDEEAAIVLDLQALWGRVKAEKLHGNQVRGRFQCPLPVELRGRDWEWERIARDYKTVADSKELGSQQDNRDHEAGYKILLGPAGRTLTSFGSDKEMMQGALDALRGSSRAYKKAGLEHCNICPGNILFTEQGRGFLIGWDVCAPAEKESGESG